MPATGPTIQLLTQSFRGLPAGVADRADRERWVRDAVEYRVTDHDRFFYYNTGYGVLGEVIEAVDGRRYADYVREEVFEPLGMDRSTFDPERFEEDDDAMTGYVPDDEAPEGAPLPFEDLVDPAGGLISSARELSRFVRASMTDGSLDGARVCTPESLERLQRGRTVWKTRMDGTEEEYGFGCYREPFPDDELVGHGGSILVSTAYAGFLESEGVGIAVACNTSAQPHPQELGAAVLAVASGHDATTVPGFALREKCEPLTGTYESFRGGITAAVEREGGGIAVTLSGPWGEDELQAVPASLDPDDREFYTITETGERLAVEFDLAGERADMFFERHRLRRVHDAG